MKLVSVSRRVDRIVRAARFQIYQPLSRLTAEAPAPPRVTAKAVYVIDADRAPMFEKNAHFGLPPTSLTKLATAMLLVRARGAAMDETVEILPEDRVIGSTMGLRVGDVVTIRDLLHGMMLPSGNDAANAAARILGSDGSAPAMNRLAAELGMTKTRFLTPHGRDAKGQSSTAHDLAVLAAEAFSVPAIRDVAGTSAYDVEVRGANFRTERIVSTVKILGEPGVIAGKTGSTRQGGACLALLTEDEGRPVVVVILGSSVAFNSGRGRSRHGPQV